MQPWTPTSYKTKPAIQQPTYPDTKVLNSVIKDISNYPPLVFAHACSSLVNRLGAVARGESFVLHGGSCAETLDDFSTDGLVRLFFTLAAMKYTVLHKSKLPVEFIARVAGQMAKPRSSNMETKDGVELPSYRGDIVNNNAFTKTARTPDPYRMVRCSAQAAHTLNFLRGFADEGASRQANAFTWLDDEMLKTPVGKEFMELARKTTPKLLNAELHEAMEVFVGHEALLLPYESAYLREVTFGASSGSHCLTSTHFPWIGERTRQLDGAHVEFLRGVINPIGVKVGPTMSPEELVKLCEILNPQNIAGKLTLITRMGSDKIRNTLPPLVEAIKKAGVSVVWVCDPMHGNTISHEGYKTRSLDKIMDEIRGFFAVHKGCGTWAGGVHLEMTGANVTECISECEKRSIAESYQTTCDPRLNARQALRVAFNVAELINEARNK